MKKTALILIFSMAIFMLVGCGDKSTDKSAGASPEDHSDIESSEEVATETEGTAASESEESVTEDENNTASNETDNEATNTGGTEEQDLLSEYSSQQIEYARVWLQLGPNQELDELYAQHIPAGTPLNPDDETSATYPEDVIQLAGVRLVDGSVTYSGNGDGTINVYNVPLRWDGVYPAGEEFYTDLIENTKLVTIDPGDDNKVIELINIQTIN
jgi:hypothetical protein